MAISDKVLLFNIAITGYFYPEILSTIRLYTIQKMYHNNIVYFAAKSKAIDNL